MTFGESGNRKKIVMTECKLDNADTKNGRLPIMSNRDVNLGCFEVINDYKKIF